MSGTTYGLRCAHEWHGMQKLHSQEQVGSVKETFLLRELVIAIHSVHHHHHCLISPYSVPNGYSFGMFVRSGVILGTSV
jgi:hypothetical protein